MRDGVTADVRWGCGKVPIASSLDQPPAEPVHPLGTVARGLVDSGDASPNRDCIGMYSPTVVRWGWRQPRVLQGAGQHHPDVLVGVAGWGCHGGQMGLWEGWWRGAVPGCRGRMQMARGGMLLCCYQSAAALLSAAASPGCKSDLNKAEDFSARSGLAVGIRSGDSVATGRPCIPAGCVKGV